MNQELLALRPILDSLYRSISGLPAEVSDFLTKQVETGLQGCSTVVKRIEETVERYQQDGAWTRTQWVMFGRGDMEKMRVSLETWKMVLSLSLDAVTNCSTLTILMVPDRTSPIDPKARITTKPYASDRGNIIHARPSLPSDGILAGFLQNEYDGTPTCPAARGAAYPATS